MIADLVPSPRLSQDPHAKMAVEAVAAVHACSWRRMMVSSRDPSCRTSLLRKPLEHDAAMFGSQSDSLRRIRSTWWRHLWMEKRTQGFRFDAELISAAFDLDPSGGDGEVPAFLQAVWTRNMNDVVEFVSAEVGLIASVCFRAELRLASSDDECGLVLHRC